MAEALADAPRARVLIGQRCAETSTVSWTVHLADLFNHFFYFGGFHKCSENSQRRCREL